MANFIFKDAEAAKSAIMASQQKEIAKLYEDWADEIGERAKYYSHKFTASAPVSERYYKELQKQLRQTSQEVSNEIYKKIKSNIYTISDAVVSDNVKWLESFGFSSAGLNAAFSYVPHETVQKLITGQIYESGWSLSSRIWSDNEQTLKDIYQVMARGLAENKPIYEITKDLESYVRPSAKLPWNLRMADGKKIYKKQVDYNAQRLARTLVQHGYQQSFIETTQKNPFVLEYIWRSNGSRVCELCASRDGVHYSKDDLPMDHPNGMCTMEPAIDDKMADKLADWFNSPDGTYPEIDEFAGNFGYQVSKVGNVQDFINKYGMSSKSPSSWFNSLTQVQKAEAKALKNESGLTWNQWYEKNIYNGDGSNLGGKKKIQEFSNKQSFRNKFGNINNNNAAPTFKSKLSSDEYAEWFNIQKSEKKVLGYGPGSGKDFWADYTSGKVKSDKLDDFFTKILKSSSQTTSSNAVQKIEKIAKTKTIKSADTQFDSAAWNEKLRKQRLRPMEDWCDDWLKTISKNELESVQEYTGTAYEVMNEYLRGISDKYVGDWEKEQIKQVTEALKKASLPKETIVRRGSNYNMLRELGADISEANKDKMIGSLVTDKGFTSTSPSLDGGFDGAIEYIIKVPKGSQAMYVDNISLNQGEQEILINRGGRFIIEDVEFGSNGKVNKIYMTLKNLKSLK